MPVCLLIIYLLTYIVRRKYDETLIRRYFFPALFLRLLFTLLYAVVLQVYYGKGDTHIYYQGILDMHRAVKDNPDILRDIYFVPEMTNYHPLMPYLRYDDLGGYTWFMLNDSQNLMVSKLGLPFSFLFDKSYLCISMCISVFSFAGCWRLFKTFYYQYPEWHRNFSIGILFLPSLLFWGGGLSKDSLSIGALGFLVYALYKIFIEKKNMVISVLIAVINAWILMSIKPYILLSFLLAVIMGMFMWFHQKIKKRAMRRLALIFFIPAALALGFYLVESLSGFGDASSKFASENLLSTVQGMQSSFESVSGDGSSFSLGNIDGSIEGLLWLFPAGIGTSLFRPFIWEVNSPLMLFSAIESLLFLVITIKVFVRIGVWKTIRIIFENPLILSCCVFAMLFAGFVGITTFNFGALARYKVPCLPFYLAFLFMTMEKSGKFSPGYLFSKKLF